MAEHITRFRSKGQVQIQSRLYVCLPWRRKTWKQFHVRGGAIHNLQLQCYRKWDPGMEKHLAYFIHQCFFSLKSRYRCVCLQNTSRHPFLSLLPLGSFHVLAQVELFCVALWGPSAEASVVPTLWTEQRRTVGWVREVSFLKGCASAKSWLLGSLPQTLEKSSFEMALQSWCRVTGWSLHLCWFWF